MKTLNYGHAPQTLEIFTPLRLFSPARLLVTLEYTIMTLLVSIDVISAVKIAVVVLNSKLDEQ